MTLKRGESGEFGRLQHMVRPTGRVAAVEWGRVLRRGLTWVALVEGLLVILLMIWGISSGALAIPKAQNLTVFQHSALVAILATATPTPQPTSTLTPGQIAAQFVPQLEEALSTHNWGRAVEIVEIMSGVDPSGEEVQQWALTTWMQYGQSLVEADQAQEAQEYFQRAVALKPDDAAARAWKETTEFYLEGRAALDAGRWADAVASFNLAAERMSEYGDLFDRLTEAYLSQGQAAIEAENWLLAIQALGEARQRIPKDRRVLEQQSRAYRGQGQAAMASQDWAAAIAALTEAREQLPDDQDVTALLGTAFRQRGIARFNKAIGNQSRVDLGTLKQARADLEAALALRTDDTEAKDHLAQVMRILTPPKRIEVNISQQRLYAWLGDALIYEFPVSTGLPGRDTATGHYRVLDKIPMAYSRIWRLHMPNWLGIYYVNGIENGFHALPIRPDGSVMWAGLLGRRASYGCIVLGTRAAKTLYDWAEIGTRVDIHY